MCGISGIWNLNDTVVESTEIEVFNNSLIHRGPDDFGVKSFLNQTCFLGHRRLSILDLSKLGHQPMESHSKRYTIVFNGEVFNFLDIKQTLQKEGINFKSNTDTEIVLAAFEKWGEKCFNMFNGMWALAIWDNVLQQFTISRDRFGIKPFYFRFIPNQQFAFASETVAFKTLKGFKRSINQELLNFEIAGMPTYGKGYSIYNDIVQLMPGHSATINKKSKEVVQNKWWNLYENLSPNTQTYANQVDEFYHLFENACKIRLVSDVKIGTALSGGLDSTAVYSTVFNLLNQNQSRTPSNSNMAYVATFAGLDIDETEFAKKAISYTNGNAVFLPNTYANLSETVTQNTKLADTLMAAPITSVSGIYKGMKENGVSVSLDGHGVDEMLFGYRDMLFNLLREYALDKNQTEFNSLSQLILSTYHANEQTRVKGIINGMSKIGYRLKQSNFVLNWKNKNSISQKFNTLKTLGNSYNLKDLNLTKPQYIVHNELHLKSLPSILRDFDRASMMNSVEIRMPFLDYRLVKFIFSLPIKAKIGANFNKQILRDAFKNKMNEEVRNRKFKVGIGSPIQFWINNNLNQWAKDYIQTIANAKELKIVTKKEIETFYQLSKTKTIPKHLVQNVWKEINIDLIK